METAVRTLDGHLEWGDFFVLTPDERVCVVSEAAHVDFKVVVSWRRSQGKDVCLKAGNMREVHDDKLASLGQVEGFIRV